MSLFLDLTQKQQNARIYRVIAPERLYEIFERNEGVLVELTETDLFSLP